LSLFSLFKKKTEQVPVQELKVDIHSHLIPAIDDGIQSIDEGLEILREFEKLGYSKVITTPHTMSDYYDNKPSDILGGLEQMREAIKKAEINVTLEAATEYYLDEHFMKKVKQKESLLTFGQNHVLVETGFINEPPELKEASFHLSMQGYKMVFAHPERYLYLIENDHLIEELVDRSVIFQLNAVSLTGCYGKPVKKLAEELIDMGIVGMVGSDCHNMGHIDLLKEARKTKYWNKLLQLDLLNNKL